MRLPPMLKLNPRSHKIKNSATIVQSISFLRIPLKHVSGQLDRTPAFKGLFEACHQLVWPRRLKPRQRAVSFTGESPHSHHNPGQRETRAQLHAQSSGVGEREWRQRGNVEDIVLSRVQKLQKA